MIKLLDVDDLTASDIAAIWQQVDGGAAPKLNGNVAWSFEGNGIRTRTTFVQAFQQLGLNYVELPNFLKTAESAQDLAGYMDPFFDLYVIRDRNHVRLAEFAQATTKPVINAMSAEAHPCEVLTDAYYLESTFESIQDVRILLWGPTTNVFKSWHSLSRVLDLNLTHYCPKSDHADNGRVTFIDSLAGTFDVVITDGWPSGFSDPTFTLSKSALNQMGDPILIPTPPVTVGNETDTSLDKIPHFVGYGQKELLLPVQKSIVEYLLTAKI